jgi:hypothetical protein
MVVGRVVSCDVALVSHYTTHNTPIPNILSTAPEDGNVMPKHVEATIQN